MVTSGAKKSSMVLDLCTGRSSIKESSNASQLITIADIGKHLQPLEISAPSHLATQHAIQLAKEVDPKAVHTAGVPTKIHVTHQCANALKILENNIDSATEDNNNSNNNLENSIEYTIDVTDALQCMAIHRSQSCGSIDILKLMMDLINQV